MNFLSFLGSSNTTLAAYLQGLPSLGGHSPANSLEIQVPTGLPEMPLEAYLALRFGSLSIKMGPGGLGESFSSSPGRVSLGGYGQA